MLRVKFGDPQETWVYVDPALGRVVASAPRLGRVERWLFNGLHSLDFAFWYDRRPFWDAGLIVLSLGGLASSGIGAWIGWAGFAGRSAAPGGPAPSRPGRHATHPTNRGDLVGGWRGQPPKSKRPPATNARGRPG